MQNYNNTFFKCYALKLQFLSQKASPTQKVNRFKESILFSVLGVFVKF